MEVTDNGAGSGLIPVTQWGELVSAFDKGGVPMPFVHEIFLIDCKIAGTGYVEDIERKTKNLDKGTLLAFQREQANKFDPLAILILNEQQEKIGYVPRAKNEVLARLMDGGKLVFGRVEEKKVTNDWINVTIKVYMRDL